MGSLGGTKIANSWVIRVKQNFYPQLLPFPQELCRVQLLVPLLPQYRLNLCYSLSCLKEEAKPKELDEKQSSLLCVLCFEHFFVTGKGLGAPGESVIALLTLLAVSPPGSLPSPHPTPTSIFVHTGRAGPLGPHAPWACFIGSRTDNAVSHLPLLLINEFLKYLYRPSHHHKCCFKEGQMVEVNEQQMEHKWSHMSNLTSSVRREAKNQGPSVPMHGGITRTTATATNGCSNFLFIQVTTIDLLRLKTSTCFL